MSKKASPQKCPGYQFFLEPTLKASEELGGSGSNVEIYKQVVGMTNLSQEIIDEMHSFTMSEVEYKLMWARTYLKNYGALENGKQGVRALTSKGAASSRAGETDAKEISRFTNKKHGTEGREAGDVPSEKKKGWREQMSDVLQDLDPYAFERLSMRLLRECGFTEVQVTKKSGDGGIDGIGKLLIKGIFSFNVAFQCKRYKRPVGAPAIRGSRGSLGTNIEKGVLITTSAFTQAAKEEADCEGKRLIDLMDGEELIGKSAEYGIGLNEVKSYEIDEGFFHTLSETREMRTDELYQSLPHSGLTGLKIPKPHKTGAITTE